MFVSYPEHEVPIFAAFAEPGTRHWRVIELPLHAPWFLLTIELPDPDGTHMSLSHTLCIAREHDLVLALQTIDAERVLGLVAMRPGWTSPSGQWTSRGVSEVWLRQADGYEYVVLKDAGGEEFDAGVAVQKPVLPVSDNLLLRLAPRKARVAGQPRRRSRRTAGPRSTRST